MSFNKNTWSKDYQRAPGIKMLGAQDAVKKGYTPKYRRKDLSKESKKS